MAAKTDKKSTSIVSRTVKNIKKHRKTKNFIRVEKKEKQEIKQKVKKSRKFRFAKKRGMIYIAHLPAGFYEKELQNYFNQFGKVTNVRLERSKKTGRSKGYAFVEFESPAVAKIAAETMNNYIMFNRILKAEFVTRKYNRKEFWKKTVDAKLHSKSEKVKEKVRGMNKPCTPLKEKSLLRRRISRLDEMIQRLKEKGIDYSYKPAIRREIADSPCTDGKYVSLNTDVPVLEVDESDQEIEFMTPPNVIKKKLLVSKSKKSPLKKVNTKGQGKIKKEKKEKIAKKQQLKSAVEQEILESSPVKQELSSNEKCEFEMKKVTPEIKKRNNKKQNSNFSQKLKSLSQEKVSKKSRKPRRNKTN